MRLTIGIKALNEERHIRACLESAVEAARPLGGEVILADSGSTDGTITIARSFPIKIVQLARPEQKSCGTGAQLAFQYARGDYFYLLDGDMVLDASFIEEATAYLDANPDVAGVGGMIAEMNTDGHDFQIRAAAHLNDASRQPGLVDRLDCGGLYRTSAIRGLGYFTDRNLHAFEEFELAARLRSKGWRLVRLNRHAIRHYGHTTGGYSLLWRRAKSGYSAAPGEVLRAALGGDHLSIVLRRLGHIRNGLSVFIWWGLLLACAVAPLPIALRTTLFLGGGLAPALALCVRRQSVGLGVYSFVSWNVTAWCFLEGLLRRRLPPTIPIEAVVVSETDAGVDAVTGRKLALR